MQACFAVERVLNIHHLGEVFLFAATQPDAFSDSRCTPDIMDCNPGFVATRVCSFPNL